ncbi:major facilitator superfamily domain-containing protein [Morchella snyderi]|nr:major facilitator superfamily domain-containing protein [Morchella snyderi]
MGMWIFEPRPLRHVPGTTQLYENERSEESPNQRINLKHATGKDSNMLLVPQPSDSPNDPLNWPLWKRDLTLVILCLAAAVAGVLGPAVAPINAVLVKEFNTTYHVVARFAGWQFWPAAVAGLVGSAFARVWGKRPVYLFSIILLFIGGIWNALATSADSFLGARVLQGFGLGAFETIVPSSIGDMYFVHQRGKRIAFYNLSFLGSTYFMPVLGGYISMHHGWRAQFQIISAFLGPIVFLIFFLVPEHAYNRPAIFNTDYATEDNLSDLDEHLGQANAAVSGAAAKEANTDTSEAAMEPVSPGDRAEVKKTFLQELKLYNGRFSDENFFKLLLSPLALFLYPATIWGFLFQGSFITWGIAVSVVLAQMFAGPPTNFTPEQLGYMYAAPFIGAVIAYFAGSLLSDYLATALARRNNNVYEPEFRVLLVVPVALFGLPGLFAYGHVAEMHLHWIVPSVLYGFLTFAVVMSCTATFTYILDAHRDVSVEMLVSVLLLKNFFAFGATYFLVGWVGADGPARVFDIMGAIQTAICFLSIFIYFFGKVQRDFMSRHNLLKWLGLYPKSVSTVAVA